jgi:hypothetical protein
MRFSKTKEDIKQKNEQARMEKAKVDTVISPESSPTKKKSIKLKTDLPEGYR